MVVTIRRTLRVVCYKFTRGTHSCGTSAMTRAYAVSRRTYISHARSLRHASNFSVPLLHYCRFDVYRMGPIMHESSVEILRSRAYNKRNNTLSSSPPSVVASLPSVPYGNHMSRTETMVTTAAVRR